MSKKITLEGLDHFKDKENAMIAGKPESTNTATVAHAVGEYFYWKGVLHIVTAAIAVGGTIQTNTNVKPAVLADDVSDLKESFTDSIKDISGSPIINDTATAQNATDKLYDFDGGAYYINATGESISITLYKTVPYNASDPTNIAVVRDYRGGNFSTIFEIPDGYKGYRFFSGNTSGIISMSKIDERIAVLERTKEPVSNTATYLSDFVKRGTFNSNGVFTESSDGNAYGSDFIPCTETVPFQWVNGGNIGVAEFWLRIYYYDANKAFLRTNNPYQITSSNMVVGEDAPVGAHYARIAFVYARALTYFTPFTVNTGTIYTADRGNVYDKTCITIAAHDSRYTDKMIADVVCDGVNDEVEIQTAINVLQGSTLSHGGKIILLNGTYIIDSLYDSGSPEVGKIGIYLKNNLQYSPYASITIEGLTIPNLVSNMEAGSCAVIQLSDACFNALTDTEKVSIIGGLPPINSEQEPTTHIDCGGSWLINNLAISIQNPYKSIIGINAQYCWSMQMSNIQMARTSYPTRNELIHQIVNANEECIGLRTLGGLNNGSGYQIENVNVRGWGTGFDVSGEHLTMIGCAARINKNGFRFGYFEDGRSAHPNVLINCCDEVCINGMRFYGGRLHPTIEFISYNRELDLWESTETSEKIEYETYATEEVPGNWYGRVTYAVNASTHYDNYKSVSFWDDGYGSNFVTVNLMDNISGPTANRPTAPQRNQMYFDTTINKAIYYINGAWVDSMGTAIN